MLSKDDAAKVEDLRGVKEIHTEVVTEVRVLAKRISEAAKAFSSGSAAKKPRKYPSAIQITSSVQASDLQEYLPVGCTIVPDRLDKSWRLSAYGVRHSRAWRLYGYVESARALLEIAWDTAMEGGYEVACPFEEFKLG